MRKLQALILLLFSLSSAQKACAMLRVLKYRALTEVSEQGVCVYARHEMNPKPENRGHPQNSEMPIVCRMSISAEIAPRSASRSLSGRTLTAASVQSFLFNTLQKTCVNYGAMMPKGFVVKAYAGLTTECASADAAERVFGEHAGQKRILGRNEPIRKKGSLP